MIVIGADTHKGSHALAAVVEGTGKARGSRQIKADDDGHLAAVRWARELDEERVWAIEDCRSCSRRLEQALLAAGERVVRVPPQRMGASRKGEREPGKSDEIDALSVARAVVQDGVERFPAAYLNEGAMDIRLLLDHRGDLVAERTRTINRLRWHLLELCPELEASLKRKALNQPRTVERVDRRLRKQATGARARIAREQIAQLRALNRQIDALHRELAERVAAHNHKLLDEQGCGALTAAILIGHTAGNQQFRSEAAFALQTGTAPIPCSSGKRTQYRLNRGGSTAAATASSTARCTPSPSPAPSTTRPPDATSRARKPKARPPRPRCAASSAISPATSTNSSPSSQQQPPASQSPKLT